MKKALASLAVIAIIYCAAAQVMGVLGEKAWRKRIADIREQSQTAIEEVQILEYRRGLFTSDVRTRMTIPGHPDIELSVIMQDHIQHGPLLFAEGPSLGLFATSGTLRIETGNAQADRKLAEIFGDSIGRIVLAMGFSGDYRLRWRLQPLAIEIGEGRWTIAESQLNATGNFDDGSSKGRMTVGRMDFTATGKAVTFAPLTVDFDTQTVEPGLRATNTELAIPQIDIAATPPQPALQIKGLSIRQTQARAGDDLDTSARIAIDQINGRLRLDKLYYAMEFRGLNRDALKRLTAHFRSMPVDRSAPAAEKAAAVAALYRQSLALLPRDASVQMAIGGRYAGVEPNAQLVLQYRPPVDGRSADQLREFADYLPLVDGTLLVKAPAALVPEQLVSPYIGAYIERSGDDYELRARLQGGNLEIGQTTLPKAALVAMYADFEKRTAAPQRADGAPSQQKAATPSQRTLKRQRQTHVQKQQQML